MTGNGSEPPKETKGDLAQVLAQAGISVIPVLGGPAAELFGYIVKPPLEKRRDVWLKLRFYKEISTRRSSMGRSPLMSLLFDGLK